MKMTFKEFELLNEIVDASAMPYNWDEPKVKKFGQRFGKDLTEYQYRTTDAGAKYVVVFTQLDMILGMIDESENLRTFDLVLLGNTKNKEGKDFLRLYSTLVTITNHFAKAEKPDYILINSNSKDNDKSLKNTDLVYKFLKEKLHEFKEVIAIEKFKSIISICLNKNFLKDKDYILKRYAEVEYQKKF